MWEDNWPDCLGDQSQHTFSFPICVQTRPGFICICTVCTIECRPIHSLFLICINQVLFNIYFHIQYNLGLYFLYSLTILSYTVCTNQALLSILLCSTSQYFLLSYTIQKFTLSFSYTYSPGYHFLFSSTNWVCTFSFLI